jgi:hypothetical protein
MITPSRRLSLHQYDIYFYPLAAGGNQETKKVPFTPQKGKRHLTKIGKLTFH